MTFEVAKDLTSVKTSALAILLLKGEDPVKHYPKLNEALNGQLSRLVSEGGFKAEKGKHVVIYSLDKTFKRLIVIGGGDGPIDYEVLREYGGTAVQVAKELTLEDIKIVLRIAEGNAEESLRAIAEGAGLANYVWSRKKDVKVLKEIAVVHRETVQNHEKVLKEVAIVTEAVSVGRDLANAPASEINPESFEKKIKEVFKGLPVELRVLHEEELRKEGLNGILAVGSGSEVRPRLVIIEYRGAGEGRPWYAVVGKGVCFDAGGLDIKSAASMLEMKFDKSGASYAVGLAYSVAKLGLKINLVTLVPLVENLPSGKSYKPLDIIRMYNGVTVEVHNTDAEGRLILADALAYATKNYQPKAMVDLATLTGSVIVALGNHAAGLFSNNEALKQKIMKAAEKTGERVWPFPMWEEYYEDIKSEFADIKNMGVGRAAGAIIGAVFLSKFVGETPWAHLDIAGTAWVQAEGPKKPYYPKGATGYGIRLLLEFLRNEAREVDH